MGTSPPAHPPLPDTAASPGGAPSPPHYEVDPRGHRVEGRAAKAPGADLVRLATSLDAGALGSVAAQVLFSAQARKVALLFPSSLVPIVPMLLLVTASAAGMDGFTLRVRRVAGVLLPVVVFAVLSGRGLLAAFVGGAPLLLLPYVTLPFGAFASHRAIVLAARARARAIAARQGDRGDAEPSWGAVSRRPRGDAARPLPTEERGAPRRRTRMGVVVLLSGFVMLGVGGVSVRFEIPWFGFLWITAGVLSIALSRDVGAPSSDRRLLGGVRRSGLVWLLPPLGASLGILRVLWILSWVL